MSGAPADDSVDVPEAVGSGDDAPPPTQPRDLRPDEALPLLRGGRADFWNAYRAIGARVPVLDGASLRGADLSGFDLSGCSLRSSDLSRCTLTRAVFDGADLTGARLAESRGERVRMAGVHLVSADIRGAVLQYADLTGAKLLEADLRGADLTGAKLTRARGEGAQFDDAKLVSADLSGAALDWADFARADLRGAVLEDSKFDAASFGLSNLAGARIAEGQFKEILDLIKATTANARAAMVTMVAAAAYSILSAVSADRLAVLTDVGNYELPMVKMETSVRMFFAFAPIACVLAFAYLHFYQYHATRLAMRLPARFPDGLTLSEKAYPWVFNILLEKRLGRKVFGGEVILEKREKGFRSVRLMSELGAAAAGFIAWQLVPAAVFALALRSIGALRWLDSMVGVGAFWLCVGLSYAFRTRQDDLLQSYARPGAPPARRWWRIGMGFSAGIGFSVLLAMPPVAGRLSAPDLRKGVMTGASLEEAALTDANLTNANLDKAWLDGADLRYAILYDAQAKGAYAPSADFYCAVLAKAHLEQIAAPKADFRRADLRGADLSGATLQAARFDGADLHDAKLVGADLSGATCDAATRWPGDRPPPGVRCSTAKASAVLNCSDEARARRILDNGR